MVHRVVFLIAFFFVSNILSAQSGSIHRFGSANTRQSESFSAIAIRSSTFIGTSVAIRLGNEEYKVPLDPDAPSFTYFLSLSRVFESGLLQVISDADSEVFLINSGVTPRLNSAPARTGQDNCTYEFPAISQTDWRAGLAPPSYNRSFTTASHVVVHHSAGSNSNSDYTQVVRDIYLYHTQVNGWSDIGYNYLIAQNGDIYAGRDPASGNQDDVLGAHFCGSNSATMGICLLGNYEETTATSATLTALQTLVSFKLEKEGLDPLGTYPHSFGSLGSIIGHRDGCRTLCPGENVYQKLSALRNDINDNFQMCQKRKLDFFADDRSLKTFQQVNIRNESYGYDSYEWVLPDSYTDSSVQEYIIASYSAPGLYDVSLIGYINNLPVDTVLRENYLEVEQGVVISPNPVMAGNHVTIRQELNGQTISLFSLSGTELQLRSSNNNLIQIPEFVDAGIYILSISTPTRTFRQRLIVL